MTPKFFVTASASAIIDAAGARAARHASVTNGRRVTTDDDCAALEEQIRALVALRDELLKELQIAYLETCNAYHWAGHANRVRAAYGITDPEDTELDVEECAP